MLLKLNVGLGENTKLVGTDVFDKKVGAIVEFNVMVGLEVTRLVGELDRDNDIDVL